MNKIAVFYLVVASVFYSPVYAGAPATLIVINGPDIYPEGIIVKGEWPGWIMFVNRENGPVPEPASGLPRYVLTGYSKNGTMYYTVLYVWDDRSKRAVVYLPGPSELGYRVNYGVDISYKKWAGKWYYVKDEGDFQGWANMIQKALPQKESNARL